MATDKDEVNFVTGTYSIPPEWKSRLEREAEDQDLNTSQYMRRILSDYFTKQDARAAKQQAKQTQSVAA